MFNTKLDQKILEKGMTEERLARRAKVGYNTVSRLLNGQGRPHLRTIYRVAHVLECTPRDIGFDGEGGVR